MAIKQKVKDEDKKSRILEVLATDYKWEAYLFLAIALVVLVLGVLILVGTVSVKTSVPIIGSFPKVFAGILVGLGVVSFIYAVYPFFKASWPELKKVQWPKWALFLSNTLKTFIFLIAFTVIFLMFDVIINEIISRFLEN